MDSLSDIYYLIQLIVRQILIFLRDFIFRELTWLTLAEENFDNANSKILDVAPHPVTDFFVLFTVCGLLFAFMILPTNSTKNEESNYDINNIEMISTAFENSSPLWYSKPANSSLISYFHDCNSINPSRDTVSKQQNISHPSFSKCRVSLQSKASNYKVRSICSRHSHKIRVNYPASQTVGQEWLSMPIDKTMATLGKQIPTNCEWNTGNVTDKTLRAIVEGRVDGRSLARSMDIKDSSDEEDERTRDIPAFGKFDETIVVRNAEEIKSPVSHRPVSSRKTRKSDSSNTLEDNSPRERKHEFRRYSSNEIGFEKSLEIGSDPSDSEESDDDDIQGTNVAKPIDLYDPKEFENLEASTEVKELFHNIMRYTPQRIELNYKLIPFIPDYIPAVGDIDAFIKVPRPDSIEDKIGLTVLDEPCTEQSDPAVLHLQLRSHSRSAGAAARQAVVKRIEDAERNGKSIDKWIDDMNRLHRSKHPPTVQLNRAMPDIDGLMEQWPAQVEDKLNELQLDLSGLDCDLPQLVDVICNLLDIPTRDNTKLEALHTLFTLFLEVKNAENRNFS